MSVLNTKNSLNMNLGVGVCHKSLLPFSCANISSPRGLSKFSGFTFYQYGLPKGRHISLLLIFIFPINVQRISE
jgi:hypothetical protein